jgi:hypothetical protein
MQNHNSTQMMGKQLTFSLMISTTALLPTAFVMLLAHVLNVPHCLQASIKMTRPTLHGTGEDIYLATCFFFSLTGHAASFSLGRDLTDLSLTVFEVSPSIHSCV